MSIQEFDKIVIRYGIHLRIKIMKIQGGTGKMKELIEKSAVLATLEKRCFR